MKIVSNLAASVKSLAKIALQSRRPSAKGLRAEGDTLLVLGNGPSLADAIANHSDTLHTYPTLAVNFAANAPEFTSIRPRYYLLADPHFFTRIDDPNVMRLVENLAKVDWPMTLLVPRTALGAVSHAIRQNSCVSVASFNAVGVEGWRWLRHWAFASGLGMPRPRNVLIPSIMVALLLGYRRVVLLGADHSWLKTLSVDDQNRVVSIQPHFYKDDKQELKRISTDYQKYPLHQILDSMAIAFRSYHSINEYVTSRGLDIVNATPGSFIDAFPRISLNDL